jgi:hypothetical protein
MGMALDDIRVEAIGLLDTGDSADGWTAEGWRRVVPVVPQRWALQAILRDPSGILRVERPPVAEDGSAVIAIDDVPSDASVVVAVSGLTRGTRLAAGYTLAPLASAP